MKKIGACPLADGFNIAFGDSILMVGTHPAEGEALVAEGAFLFKCGGCEDAVVGMVFLDCCSGFGGEGFELAFALDGGIGIGRVWAKIEDVATGVVNEEAAACEPMLVGREGGVESATRCGDVVVG